VICSTALQNINNSSIEVVIQLASAIKEKNAKKIWMFINTMPSLVGLILIAMNEKNNVADYQMFDKNTLVSTKFQELLMENIWIHINFEVPSTNVLTKRLSYRSVLELMADNLKKY